MAEVLYQHGLGAPFFAERGAETAHQGYATLTAFKAFETASRDNVQSLDYLDTLRQKSTRDLLGFMLSTSTEKIDPDTEKK